MPVDTHKFKKNIYGQLARIGKSLASPKRLEIIDYLLQGPKTVEAIAKETEMSIANTSQHLQTLLQARLVDFEKEGPYSYYQLSDQMVADMFQSMQHLGENLLTEIQTLIRDVYGKKGDIEQVDIAHLLDNLKRDKVTLVDVRSKEDYGQQHIPGAISIELDELEENLSALPQDQEIIAYCRGRYCILSLEAVKILKSHGYKAATLEDHGYDMEIDAESASDS